MRNVNSEHTESEIIEMVKSIPTWNLLNSDRIMREIMKQLEGKCSPSKIRPIVERFIEGVK